MNCALGPYSFSINFSGKPHGGANCTLLLSSVVELGKRILSTAAVMKPKPEILNRLNTQLAINWGQKPLTFNYPTLQKHGNRAQKHEKNQRIERQSPFPRTRIASDVQPSNGLPLKARMSQEDFLYRYKTRKLDDISLKVV